MATLNVRQGPPIGTALVVVNKDPPPIVRLQGLERPVSSLAENVQKVMGAFYDVHKALIARKGLHKGTIERFKEAKHLFRTECESLRQVLQSGYRHAVDFTSSCQRAPNDRHISAKRCQLSGKSVLRDLQEVNRVYDRDLQSFRTQEKDLKDQLTEKNKKSGQSRSSTLDSQQQQTPKDAHPELTVTTLFSALEDVRSSLWDILAFWENHAAFLTLIVNRQSNFPSPGDETKATVEIWIKYQAALLQASSSIAQSADAMTIDPAIVQTNGKTRRRNTYPQARADGGKLPLNDRRSYPAGADKANRSDEGLYSWWKKICRFFSHSK
ncbi:hypothetical protein JR316_0010493 [Psilocybe cubensis]|uniref:Uncharacterized protein n=2 Tax=Psilocybe cubensis TaxID=181762 RepID=A0ACB8GM11_PSICU|nr:hypothetical protein JR316_0010493 [Psilocybe cubensis]KAH9476581.1 hypothetical protein JR316_0010493 [Psilocybe cubensis]